MYSMIYLLPPSTTLIQRVIRFVAKLLFIRKGLNILRAQQEPQFISTIVTANIAEKILNASFLTAIST